MINLIKFGCIKKCTHLDLSGIDALIKANLSNILGELEYENCGNLLGLHLNDLGVNFN